MIDETSEEDPDLPLPHSVQKFFGWATGVICDISGFTKVLQ